MRFMKFWWMEEEKADSILDFEKELEEIRGDIEADCLMFLGVYGSIKGLPLIQAKKENVNTKIFAGMMAENYLNLKKTGNIFSLVNIKSNLTNFRNGVLYSKRINHDIVFSAYLSKRSQVKNLEKWLKNTKSEIQRLFKRTQYS